MTNPASQRVSFSLADEETRKLFKSRLSELTHYHREAADIKDGLREAVAAVAKEYGVDKKTVAKMAKTMYASNYASQLEEQRQFEQLYETIVENRLRDPDDLKPYDPIDAEE